MITWHIEKRLIKELKPHPKNARKLTKEQALHIAVSMDKFGLADLPVVNLDNMIIGGHQRINILKKQKVKEVLCSIPDRLLDEREAEELLVRLNRNHGDWDWDMLGNEFNIPDLAEWGFNLNDFEIPDESDEEPGERETDHSKCPTCGKKIKK